VYGHNGTGVLSDEGVDFFDVEVEGDRVDIRPNRPRPQTGYGTGGGEKGEGGDDHFVPRPDPQGHHADQEGIGAATDAHGVGDGAIAGDIPLEAGHGLPQDELLGVHQLGQGGDDFIA